MYRLNVLIACEESQAICKEFRKLGHNAFSCDIQDCSGGEPQWHIKGDVRGLLNRNNIAFLTQDRKLHTLYEWDLIIAHPPCTYLSIAATRSYSVKCRGKMAVEERIKNVMKLRISSLTLCMQTVNTWRLKIQLVICQRFTVLKRQIRSFIRICLRKESMMK